MRKVYALCRSMCALDDEPQQPLYQAEELELTPHMCATARKQKRRATASSQESLFLTPSASPSISLLSCDEAVALRFCFRVVVRSCGSALAPLLGTETAPVHRPLFVASRPATCMHTLTRLGPCHICLSHFNNCVDISTHLLKCDGQIYIVYAYGRRTLETPEVGGGLILRSLRIKHATTKQ